MNQYVDRNSFTQALHASELHQFMNPLIPKLLGLNERDTLSTSVYNII